MNGKFTIVLIICLLLSGCSLGGDGDFELLEKAFHERQLQEDVMYMSLDTMFPDRQARDLAEAAGKGNIGKVEELVKQGVNVNSRGKHNATPLFWAIRNNNIDGFKKLLELGANPNLIINSSNKDQKTINAAGGEKNVIHIAAKLNDEAFLVAALQYGGNPNVVTGDFQETPLFDAVMNVHNDKALIILLNAGANINFKDSFGATPVMQAVYITRFDLVYELLNKGADYKIKNNANRDLMDEIARTRRLMNPKYEQAQWMGKVISWLESRGETVPP
jgi:ankyrin repeat protein